MHAMNKDQIICMNSSRREEFWGGENTNTEKHAQYH